MRNPKKIIFTALAVMLLVGATPAFAQIAGNWEGTGSGCCYPYEGIAIYPWQSWQGEIPNAQNVFNGEWSDESGNQGTFRSRILWISVTTAIASGSWYWYDPAGAADPVYGGDFKMKFQTSSEGCSGTWTTIWPSPSEVGTMIGWRAD
jgi:hypothetical protein